MLSTQLSNQATDHIHLELEAAISRHLLLLVNLSPIALSSNTTSSLQIIITTLL